jgi:hypothetical protein
MKYIKKNKILTPTLTNKTLKKYAQKLPNSRLIINILLEI